jgi:hypothetical protein
MDNTEGLYRSALHEASHALMAYSYGWPIVSVRCSAPRDGCTRMVLPLECSELQERYNIAPRATQRSVTQIVATLVAPAVVLNTYVDGGDLNTWVQFKTAWESAMLASHQPGLGWPVIAYKARAAVRTWLAAPGRYAQLHRVADVLVRQRYLSASAWKNLMTPHSTVPLKQAPDQRAILNHLRPENVYYGSSWRDYASSAGYILPLFS